MEPTTTKPADAEVDYGRTPESLAATLRSSKVESALFDPPLPLPAKEPIRRWLPRYWLTRLYLVGSILTTFLMVCLLPQSVLGDVVEGSRTAQVLAAIITGLALAGLLDVVINDLLPSGYSLGLLKDNRHWVFNGIALGLLGLFYAVVRAKGWSPILIAFADDLAIALAVAPLDLFARYRESRK